MRKKIVILNEQHKLLDEQIALLLEGPGTFETLSVPAEGWTLPQMGKVLEDLSAQNCDVVFASPIPWLLGKLAALVAAAEVSGTNMTNARSVSVLHNDLRDKKELPGGRVVFTVAATGWQLLTIAGTPAEDLEECCPSCGGTCSATHGWEHEGDCPSLRS